MYKNLVLLKSVAGLLHQSIKCQITIARICALSSISSIMDIQCISTDSIKIRCYSEWQYISICYMVIFVPNDSV